MKGNWKLENSAQNLSARKLGPKRRVSERGQEWFGFSLNDGQEANWWGYPGLKFGTGATTYPSPYAGKNFCCKYRIDAILVPTFPLLRFLSWSTLS